MDDLISRQAAIDAINQICPIDTEYDCTLLDRVDVRCVLTDLPSAQPRWIPCSERLPEVGRSVLISVGGMYTAEGCLREDGDWTQFRWDAIQRKDMVGAWMPLPEPWRGEEKWTR